MSTYIVTVRHPDAGNDHRSFGGDIRVIDIDLGRGFCPSDYRYDDEHNAWEALDWCEGHLAEAAEVAAESPEAAAYIREVVAEAIAETGVTVAACSDEYPLSRAMLAGSPLVTVRIESVYSDGHRSERLVQVPAPILELDPDGDLEDDEAFAVWWQEVVFPLTGDGHGKDDRLGSCLTATIVDADNPALERETWEWLS